MTVDIIDTKPGRERVEIRTGVGRKRRWSDEERGRIVAEAVTPGAVVSEVARRHDMSPQHLFRWIRAAKEGKFALPADIGPASGPLAGASFVPVMVEPAETRRWEYRPGTARDLTEPFGALGRAATSKLVLRDPYLLTGERNRRLAVDFLKVVTGIGAKLELVTLVWREDSLRKPAFDRENVSTQRADFEKRMANAGLSNVRLRFEPQQNRRGVHFHDRQVLAVVREDGIEKQLRWDITSGIDNLMDTAKECIVFACKA